MTAPISVFDLFKVGIGPSSSHTVGPMRAALQFAEMLESAGCADRIARVQVELFASLALTGRGHATDKAVVLGLLGERPDTVDPNCIEPLLTEVQRSGQIALLRRTTIPFSIETDVVFRGDEALPRHPNALRLTAWAADGCQGEVGVACSMAAAGLAAVMGGTNEQIENAAEIGMEHHLGLTCDPVAGLVQVPCIERNAMGAATAINAARLAVLYGDGRHRVSLDQVIETMRQTGLDMQSKYKETSRGGLALNVVDC